MAVIVTSSEANATRCLLIVTEWLSLCRCRIKNTLLQDGDMSLYVKNLIKRLRRVAELSIRRWSFDIRFVNFLFLFGHICFALIQIVEKWGEITCLPN